VLEDEQLRGRIAANGRRFYDERLTATTMAAAVATVARATADLSADGVGSSGRDG
jgi:hypothetical protein